MSHQKKKRSYRKPSQRHNYQKKSQRSKFVSQQTRLPSSLKRCLGKEITVSIKIKGHYIKGILREFDQHLNLVMENVTEYDTWRRHPPKELGKIIVRGDSIIYVDFEGTQEFVHKFGDRKIHNKPNITNEEENKEIQEEVKEEIQQEKSEDNSSEISE